MSYSHEPQIKTQLQQICEYLLANMQPIVKANDIDAWQTDGELLIDGSDLGNDGYLAAKWKHKATISIERFPHRKINPYNLLGMIAAFLIDCDWDRDTYELSDPDLDIEAISKDNSIVLIELELLDDIELTPDPNGPIPFRGNRYRVALVPIDFADSAEVQQAANKGAN